MIKVKYDVILDEEREKDMPEFNIWNFVFTLDGDIVLDLAFEAIQHL